MSESTLVRPFGFALGVHMTAGLAFVTASWLAMGAIPPPPDLRPVFYPPIRVTFDDGGGRPAVRRETPREAKPTPRPAVLQPVVNPEPLPVAPNPVPEPGPAPPEGPEGGPWTDGPGGTGGNGEGAFGPGRGDGPPGEDLPGFESDDPIDVAPDMVPPRLIRKVTPEYPDTARRARIPGTVVLRAVIGPDGSVEDVRVVRASSPLFVDAAVEAVERWLYTPARQNGRAVRVWFEVVVEFKLR